MSLAFLLLACSAACLVYVYFGYPLILWFLARRRRAGSVASLHAPSVTVVIAAHNEEESIGQTLDSLCELEFPRDKIDVIVVSDGSTDRTDKIVSEHPDERVRLISVAQRRGKTRALAAAISRARSNIIVSTDAGTTFAVDSFTRLLREFADESVGAVVGTKTIVQTGSTVAQGDGFYWRYERALRALESRSGSSHVGLEGGFFAVRRELVRLDFPVELAEDFALGCRVYELGYRCLYEPGARAFEHASANMPIEFRRKVRVIVRGMRVLWAFRHFLNPLRHPGFAFQNVSHKILRWLAPFALVTLFVVSATEAGSFSRVVFVLQCVFYSLALAGLLQIATPVRFRVFAVPLYFVVVNLAGMAAWLSLPRSYATWKPTLRERSHSSVFDRENSRREVSSPPGPLTAPSEEAGGASAHRV